MSSHATDPDLCEIFPLFFLVVSDCTKRCFVVVGQTVTICRADVIFVMDTSGSIDSSEYQVMKTFVSDVVDQLDVDSGDARVGAVTFDSNVNTADTILLNEHTTAAGFQADISNLPGTGGFTNTGGALQYVRDVMLTGTNGDRSTAPNAVIVLTDGRSNAGPDTAVSIKHGT